MTIKTLGIAIKEAKRFICKAEEVIAKEVKTNEEAKRKAKEKKTKFVFSSIFTCGCRETGAVKRASADLSDALIRVRK